VVEVSIRAPEPYQSLSRYQRIAVEPLTPYIGAFVQGADLAELDGDTWREIELAFADRQVLFFRDQRMTAVSMEALGRRLGELFVQPADHTTVDGHSSVLETHADAASTKVAGTSWHIDVSYVERPPLATILWNHTCPPLGGDTVFSSLYAAYDALSDRMKTYLDGLSAHHDSIHMYPDRDPDADEIYPKAVHPIVRRHPVTGRKALYINRQVTTRIVGLSKPESRAILEFLADHQEHYLFQCRFRWEPNSLAMWDNRCVQHAAAWDYFPATRSGLVVNVIGDRPVG
jgi:taurine dioxygenase